MADKNRRRHSKIHQLPDPVVEEINRLLVSPGITYEMITDHLKKLGHDVSKSSVGRYGKDFVARLERLKIVKDQAKAILDEGGDRPATELQEAANQMAMQLIMETLMKVDNIDVSEDGEKLTDVLKALANLERSAVSREKLKFEFNKGVEAAAAKIKEALKKELMADTDLQQKMMEVVEQAKAQIAG